MFANSTGSCRSSVRVLGLCSWVAVTVGWVAMGCSESQAPPGVQTIVAGTADNAAGSGLDGDDLDGSLVVADAGAGDPGSGFSNSEALPGVLGSLTPDQQGQRAAGKPDLFDAGIVLDAEAALDAQPQSTCEFSGSVQYRLNDADSWPQGVEERLDTAMREATGYYNCYSNLSHQLTVNYNPGVPTAEANVDGWMSFGSNQGYMVVATAMHEIAHTLGVGFSPWNELIENGRLTGASVVELMANLPPEERDPDDISQRDFITADRQHFWPYGLNLASEHLSEWSLINNVRIVAAIAKDKQRFLDGN